MAITTALCTSFKVDILDGTHDFGADTFRVALYTSSATLGATTTAYTTTGEVVGTGYVAGGELSAAVAATSSGTTAYVDLADVSWTTSTFTARGMLIYNVTNSNKAVAVIDFGADFAVSSGTFTVEMPTANATDAIVRIA